MGAVAVFDLDGTPGHGVAPDTESFDGSASYSKNPSATITRYRWSFGDETPEATGPRVTHTFASPGAYAVTLTVTDSDGSTASASQSIQVTAPRNPGHTVIAVARLDGTPGGGPAPDTETFDGTGSHSSVVGATLERCQWDFGDGAQASGCQPTHIFQDAGSYTVTLRAFDSDGASGTATLSVEVTAPAEAKGVVAVVRLDGTSGHGVVPDTEAFDGTGSHSRNPHATLAACSWDFGDGHSATGCKTSHTFQSTGSFTVTLTASDSDGSHAQASLPVQVDARPEGSVRWSRGFPSTAWVGTDFDTQAAVAFGVTVGALDPENGHLLWSNSYPEPASSVYTFTFRGPLAVLPGTPWIYAEEREQDGPAPVTRICRYAQDGDRTCLGGSLEESGRVLPMSMGAGGEIAWGFQGAFDVYANLLQPLDGSTWRAQLWQGDPGPEEPEVVDTAAEPGGDLVIAARATGTFVFDGQTLRPGNVLVRANAQGQLLWSRATPFEVLDLGTTSAGTVVALVQAPADFPWGDGHASGTALVVTESDGTPRWVRPLAAAEWAQLSVLPKGRVAVGLNRSGCGGSVVYRFDLAGELQWEHDFAQFGCGVSLSGVAIRPYDVLVSGTLAGAIDFGQGPLSGGGFVVDLEGGG
jgi:PKD repeat protein